MAVRPVFEVISYKPFYRKVSTEFVYCSGFSMAQRQRCVDNLHSAWLEKNNGRILEVSRASRERLGQGLSAFCLKVPFTNGGETTVECLFQGSKCFEKGGPYTDLYYTTSKEAKQDPRLKESGNLVKFSLQGRDFPLDPPTYFYDWLYINALNLDKKIHNELLSYDAFTDIMFNPEKQINCQAEAVAIFVGLSRYGLLEKALESKESFLDVVFG